MSVRVNGMAIAASICFTCSIGSAAAQPRYEVPDARTICSAISTSRPAHSTAVAPTKARTESDRLVAEAAALMAQPSRQSVTGAIVLLEQATTTDASNGVAFARLSAAYGDSRRYADVPAPIAAARRWNAATKAYILDPDNVLVLINLAHSVVVEERDLDCAERILLHAREIAPRDPDINFGLANLRGSKGDFKAAFAYLDTSVAHADPAKRLALQYNSGRLYFMARENRRVIDHYAALIEANPDNSRNSLAHFYRGLAFAAEGDYHQALAEVTKTPPGRDGDAGAVANLARIQILAGERAAGEGNLQLLLDRDARGEHVVSYQIAAIYEALGNRDEAFRWLARYTEEVDGLGSWLLWLRHDSRWDRTRDDPRFAAVLGVGIGPIASNTCRGREGPLNARR
jgi:tetratricopeptide (TPR) repeat protein